MLKQDRFTLLIQRSTCRVNAFGEARWSTAEDANVVNGIVGCFSKSEIRVT